MILLQLKRHFWHNRIKIAYHNYAVLKKIMAKQTSLSRSGFLPPAVAAVLKRRLHQSLGFLIAVIAIPLGILLATYHPFDPSFNTATDQMPDNLLLIPGALVADLLVQLLGFGSWLLIPALVVLGGHFMLEKPVRSITGKTAALIVSVFLGSCFLGTIPNIGTWMISEGCGGAIGILTQMRFKQIMSPFGSFCTNFVLLMGFLISYGYSLGISFAHLKTVWGFLGRIGRWTRKKAPQGKIKESVPSYVYEDASEEELLADYTQAEFDFGKKEVAEEGIEGDGDDEPVPQKKKGKIRLFSAPSAPSTSSARVHQTHQGDDYNLPSPDLLDDSSAKAAVKPPSADVLQEYARQLEEVLQEFGVRGEIVAVYPGPVVTLYELKPAAGIKTARVIGLADDIARSMSALSARIAVVPGRNVIGIEMPNPVRETVFLKDLLLTEMYQRSQAALPLILGKDIGGQPVVADMVRMPHLLVAGTTGSGKSVSVNTMILSVLFRMPPDKCRFIMIDPKMLELSIYDGIPHLLTPVVTDPKKAVVALKWAVREMESRYRAMSKLGVRNIDGYNERIRQARATGELLMRRVQTGFDPDSGKPIFETQSLDVEPLPFIVIVVDEMADLMLVAGKDIEAAVQRLAQMARAAGIHLIMATQRPSVDVITGTIKANFPTRISFQVTSKIDSRTILGDQGAEQLLGQGDMLYMAGGGRVTRVHGPFVRDDEVERIVQFLKTQGEPTYVDSITEEEPDAGDLGGEESKGTDPLYQQAVEMIRREGKASTSFVQRCFQIGYNRAARMIEQMEKEGIVSPANGAGKREVLAS